MSGAKIDAIHAMKGLPLQPIRVADDGVVRFRENRIVVAFLTAATDGRRLSLNEIGVRAAHGEFSKEEQMQFAQLIGYSTDGFGDLSYAAKRVVQYADRTATRIFRKRTVRK